MKKIDKKLNIIIEGERKDGYVIKLPPRQVPHDFHLTFDEWYAFYKISHQYFKSIKLHEK